MIDSWGSLRSIIDQRGVLRDDRPQAAPAVVDVAGRAPQVADRRSPLPRLDHAPLADRIDDRPAGGAQRVAHGGVPADVVRPAAVAVVVAVVVLEVVDAPLGERLRVDILEAQAAGISGAGGRAGVAIQAELETALVHVVRRAS